MAFEPITDREVTSGFLAGHLVQELLALAGAAAPVEACGLLFGSADEGPDLAAPRVKLVVELPNVAREGQRQESFELDPVAWSEAEREARVRGEVLVGIWHSHPDGPPRPSRMDEAGAAGLPTGIAYVVVDLSAVGSPGAISLWKWGPATRPSAQRGDRRGP